MIRSLRHLAAALAAWAMLAGTAAAGDARRAMEEGFTLLEAGSYDAAARKFQEASTAAGREGLDPAVPLYNCGVSLLRAGNAVAAEAAFAEALRFSTPALKGRVHYNRGLALDTVAESLERRGETAGALKVIGQALEAYERAMRADPADEDPKVNHELASRRRAQLEEKLKEQEGGGGARAGQPQGAQRPEETGAADRGTQGPQREMTHDEARMMLEAMRQQEISQRSQARPFRGAPLPVDRDW